MAENKLSINEVSVMLTSINLFLSNGVTGLDEKTKKVCDNIARSIKAKIQQKNLVFTPNEVRVLYIAVKCFRNLIIQKKKPEHSQQTQMRATEHIATCSGLLFLFEQQPKEPGLQM